MTPEQAEEKLAEVRKNPVLQDASRESELKAELQKIEKRLYENRSELRRVENDEAECLHVLAGKCSNRKPARFNPKWEYCPNKAKTRCEKCETSFCGTHIKTHYCKATKGTT